MIHNTKFCIALDDYHRSQIWIASINKNDLYLSPGGLGGKTKISIHESGDSHFAMDDKQYVSSKESIFGLDDRKIQKWHVDYSKNDELCAAVAFYPEHFGKYNAKVCNDVKSIKADKDNYFHVFILSITGKDTGYEKYQNILAELIMPNNRKFLFLWHKIPRDLKTGKCVACMKEQQKEIVANQSLSENEDGTFYFAYADHKKIKPPLINEVTCFKEKNK